MTFAQLVFKAAPSAALQAWLLRAVARLRRARVEHPRFDLHMAWIASVVLVAGLTSLIPVRATGSPGDVVARVVRLSGGDLSDKRLQRAFALDPGAALIVERLHPAAPQSQAPGPGPAAINPSTQDLPGLTPDQARQINAAIPFSLERSPSAKPFLLPAADPMDQTRAIDCLTAAIYYEAGSEPLAGQQAVAQVVLNRVRHPAFPKTVCGVVFEGSNLTTGCQFTFTCDGSLARAPQPDAWLRARRVAAAALGGFVMPAVGDATHYHAEYVVPYWATTMVKISKVGSQIFYRWTGGWGAPGAFTGRYAGVEPVVDLTSTTQAQVLPAGLTVTPAPPAPAPITVAKTPEVVVSAATVTPVSANLPAPIASSTHRFAINLPWPAQTSSPKSPPPAAKAAPVKPAPTAAAKPAAPSTPETITAGPAWERR